MGSPRVPAAVQMLTAARVHCFDFLLHRFVEAISDAEPALRPVLNNVRALARRCV